MHQQRDTLPPSHSACLYCVCVCTVSICRYMLLLLLSLRNICFFNFKILVYAYARRVRHPHFFLSPSLYSHTTVSHGPTHNTLCCVHQQYILYIVHYANTFYIYTVVYSELCVCISISAVYIYCTQYI